MIDGGYPGLIGLPIRESDLLVGSKKAFKLDGCIFVSPAMFSLMRTATPGEMVRLLHAIKVQDLGKERPEVFAKQHA